MSSRNTLVGFLTLALLALLARGLAFAGYHLERITPVLNQPTFITQAPGDPAHILYYTTRITSSNGGFNANNTMGKVWRYNVNTRVSTEILILTNRTVTQDTGLHVIAFHPDFTNAAAIGYGRMYVSSARAGSGAINHVDEFVVLNPNGSLKTPSEVFNTLRPILRYNNLNTWNNHSIGWIGFDPTATGPARNYLHIISGDGAFANPFALRPSQDPNDIRGKLLRVDISGADDYPTDTNRNYAVPPSNPIPAWNAANPPIAGLGEIFATGLRNGYRASFDRLTGDFYWGDVGDNSLEEVNFMKAGINVPGYPVDYGWPVHEGVPLSPVSPISTNANPYTGVPSFNPIRQFQNVSSAVMGGYVYRGPIAELQGKYFYCDFVRGTLWMLDFNRNTAPASFNGANGVLTNVTTLWSQRILDPADPSYRGDLLTSTINGIDRPVSFGEDNEGNLYVIDFSYGIDIFNDQYRAGAGEIFKLVPDPTLNWSNTPSGLQLSWSSAAFKLQVQTNTLAAGLGANWFDYPGGSNSPVTIPFDGQESSRFLRLKAKP